MRIDAVAEGLDDADHAGPQLGLEGRGGHQLLDRLPGEASQGPAQLAPAEEERPQHLRNREDPLRVPDVLEDLIDEEGRELRAPLGSAGRA